MRQPKPFRDAVDDISGAPLETPTPPRDPLLKFVRPSSAEATGVTTPCDDLSPFMVPCILDLGHEGLHKSAGSVWSGKPAPAHRHECQHGHPHDGRCECVCGHVAWSASKQLDRIAEEWHAPTPAPETPPRCKRNCDNPKYAAVRCEKSAGHEAPHVGHDSSVRVTWWDTRFPEPRPSQGTEAPAPTTLCKCGHTISLHYSRFKTNCANADCDCTKFVAGGTEALETPSETTRRYNLLCDSINEDDSTCPEGCSDLGHVEECEQGMAATIIEGQQEKIASLRSELERARAELVEAREQNRALINDQRAFALCVGADPDTVGFDGVTDTAIRLWQEMKALGEQRDEARSVIESLAADREALIEGMVKQRGPDDFDRGRWFAAQVDDQPDNGYATADEALAAHRRSSLTPAAPPQSLPLSDSNRRCLNCGHKRSRHSATGSECFADKARCDCPNWIEAAAPPQEQR